MNRNDIFKANGKVFGYPQCCIDSFCQTMGAMEADENQLKVAQNGYGFIPCPKHAKQILDKEITIESLIKDRDTSLPPFPIDNL